MEENKEKVKFITLGCRVNQYDTQAMRESLLLNGYEQAGKDNRMDAQRVDVVVINTCTVTQDADKESRYWVRRARNAYPDARIVVTGCGVSRNRKEIEALPGVDLVIENHDKGDLANLLGKSCSSPFLQDLARGEQESVRRKKLSYTPLTISRSEGAGRAFVKVQDGCNHACSFCKVVLARGRSRSRPLQEILLEVIRLRDAGYKEIVFAGIQLGAYGDDLGGLSLEDVLRETARVDGIERLRLSSIEPTDVSDALIQTMFEIKKCVPHLHIPLQSGSDAILKQMNRRYDRNFYLELIQKLRSGWPDFALSCDVMAGFPGETEEDFEQTLDLLQRVLPVKTHAFPYSKREGTKAALMRDLPPDIIRRRMNALLSAGEMHSLNYKQAYQGKILPVLVEHFKESEVDQFAPHQVWLYGLTANFMKVAFLGSKEYVSQILPVHLLKFEGDSILGTLVSK